MGSDSGSGGSDQDLREAHSEWHFDFVLQGEDPSAVIPRALCEELLDVIIDWVEARQLAIGGGYGPCEYEDGD